MEKPTRVQDSDSTSLGFPRVPTGPLPAQGPVQGTTSQLAVVSPQAPHLGQSPEFLLGARDTLKSPGQGFCRTSLRLGLSTVCAGSD